MGEQSKVAEAHNTLSEESLEAVHILPEAAKQVAESDILSDLTEESKSVAEDKSLSDLVKADKSAQDSKLEVENSSSDLTEASRLEDASSSHSLSDDVSDEARWFLHGTCSCDEHQSPGQEVATCQVDILRPEPEKYTYLGYNNCDQGYVPVCGRIFTVCYCLCKWDYNAATTTASPATTSAPHDGHGHE